MGVQAGMFSQGTLHLLNAINKSNGLPPELNKYQKLVFGIGRIAHRTDGHLTYLQAGSLPQHLLNILWIPVLTADKQNVPGATGNIQSALTHQAQVAGIQPAIDKCRRIACAALVVAPGYIRAADLHMPDAVVCQCRTFPGTDTQLATVNRMTKTYQFHTAPGMSPRHYVITN